MESFTPPDHVHQSKEGSARQAGSAVPTFPRWPRIPNHLNDEKGRGDVHNVTPYQTKVTKVTAEVTAEVTAGVSRHFQPPPDCSH